MYLGITTGESMGQKPSDVIEAWYRKALSMPGASEACNQIYDVYLAVRRIEDEAVIMWNLLPDEDDEDDDE